MFSLLLDFDGTLFDTESGHEAAYQKTFDHFNLGPFPSYETLKGIKTKEVFARYHSIYADTDSMANYKSSTYQEGLANIKPLVDLDLLLRVNQAGVNLYIVTGGSRKSIEGILRIQAIESLFKGIVCAEDYQSSKPDPEPFLHCVKQYQIQGEMHGVEDSLQGIQSVRAANIHAVGVHNPAIEPHSDVYYASINTYLTEILQTR
jgi:HAD superfamily hydrolase (TIGR01509 family)